MVFSNKTVAMSQRGIETVKRVSVVFDIIQLDIATMLIRSISLACFVLHVVIVGFTIEANLVLSKHLI